MRCFSEVNKQSFTSNPNLIQLMSIHHMGKSANVQIAIILSSCKHQDINT